MELNDHNYFKSENIGLVNKTFQCHICTSIFKYRGSLYNHLKAVHKVKNIGNKPVKCLEENCDACFRQLLELEKHLNKEHLRQIEKEELLFESLEEFKAWKNTLEENTNSEYVTYSPRRSFDTISKMYFKCSRSSFSPGTRNRRLMSQGSKKSGTHCISRMVVNINNDDKSVKVIFCKTHYGHLMDLAHVSLSKIDKEKIAASLIQGVSVNAILDKIRNTVVGAQLDRIHLLTKKDIKNIEKSYGLNLNVERHANDLISVNAWVKELETSSQNPIILFKNQGEPRDGFDKNDFLLGVMTFAQSQMLIKFGNGGIICMDSTHGTNPYDFTLITLMVIDNFNEGFPVAFFYTNKENTKSITEFLTGIKNVTGQIDAGVFMSDDAEQYYNTWKSIMGCSSRKLLCSWHIDRAWRKNLYLIKSKEKQVEVYKILKVLQCETHKDVFESLHLEFCKKLHNDTELLDFYHYFKSNYSNRVETWAYCYRTGCEINTNMYIESLHRVINVYMGGMKNRRLDKSVHLLINLVKNKLFERLIKLHKGKTSTKIADIEYKHREALQLPKSVFKKKSTSAWIFISQQDRTSEYIIEKVNSTLLEAHQCNLKCIACECCVHDYTCTCPDFLIKGSMCKHIHTVAWNQKEDTVQILNEINKPQLTPVVNEDINSERQNVISILKYLIVEVNKETSIETLAGVKKHLKCCKSLLELKMSSLPKETKESQVCREHPKKKIELQDNYSYPRKKKRKTNNV